MGSRRRATGIQAAAGGAPGGRGRKRRKRAGKPAARPAAAKAKPGRFPEVEELVELMDRHGLLEVDFHTAPDGSRRIRVARAGAGGWVGPASAPVQHGRGGEPAHGYGGGQPGAAHGSAAAATAGEPAEKLHPFNSPMVGTFYRAPSPEAPPFVSVGDKIDEHRTVCIIEAMKVMNEITPDISGEVVSIEVENGEAVEYGQTLFLVRRA